jgi:hypothetical protein
MARFQPGTSGNPGGRHKGCAEVAALARQHGPEAVETLVSIMRDESKSPQARIAAASVILDRGYGKPMQALRHEGLGTVLQVVTGILRAPGDEPILITDESDGDESSPPDGVTH